MNRVAIIVLNWNGIKDTLTCLDSLRQQTSKNYEIILIDNGSVDDSVYTLEGYESKHPNLPIRLIRNPTNLGFAGGVNIGIRLAIEYDFDYIALLNNDAIAEPSWLDELIAATESNEIGIVTGLLLHEDGKTIDSTGEFYSKWGLPFPRDRNKVIRDASKSGNVFGATGGGTLYKTSVFKDVGFFDEDFFAYYEDVDISFRAQLSGYRIAYNPKAIAYHKQGATSKKIPGFTVYQTFKNLPLLFIKNVPTSLLFSVGIRFYSVYLLMYANSFTHQTGWMATKGAFKALILMPKAIKQRIYIQRNKKVTDEYIKNILWDDLPPDQTGVRKIRNFFTGK